MFRAFRHPAFRLLWTAYVFVQLSHWMITIGFQWVLPHSSSDDSLLLGLLFFCTLMPYLLFSLPAGALADRRDRRHILMASQGFTLALAAAATVCAALDFLPVPLVLAFGFVAGTAVTLVSPANQALVANVVPAEDLVSAIPLVSAGLNLVRTLAPVLAAPLLLLLGARELFVGYGLICLTVLVLVWRLKSPPQRQRPPAEPLGTRIRRGVEHARERRPVGSTLAVVAVTSVFCCAYQAQLPVLGTRISGDGDTAFLVLLVCGGLGALAFVYHVARRGVRSLSAITVDLVLLGVVTVAMGSVRSYPLMCVIAFLVGGLLFSIMTSANTLIQHAIEDAQRGRVMSLYFLCWGGVIPFGTLGLGALSQSLGMPAAFALFGGVASLAGAFIGVRNRGVRLPAPLPATAAQAAAVTTAAVTPAVASAAVTTPLC